MHAVLKNVLSSKSPHTFVEKEVTTAGLAKVNVSVLLHDLLLGPGRAAGLPSLSSVQAGSGNCYQTRSALATHVTTP